MRALFYTSPLHHTRSLFFLHIRPHPPPIHPAHPRAGFRSNSEVTKQFLKRISTDGALLKDNSAGCLLGKCNPTAFQSKPNSRINKLHRTRRETKVMSRYMRYRQSGEERRRNRIKVVKVYQINLISVRILLHKSYLFIYFVIS